MGKKIKVDFFAKDVSKVLKKAANEVLDDYTKDLKTEGIKLDIECPQCGKTIKNAFVKHNRHYMCPHCKQTFPVTIDIKKD